MKAHHLKPLLLLSVALLANSNAFADTYTYGGTNPSNYLQFTQSGSLLTADPASSASLSSIMTGNAAAPGGNTELFASSTTLSNSAFAAYTGTTTVSVDFGTGNLLTLSSLTAADWGVVGSGKLLDQWTSALFSAYYSTSDTLANRTAFENLFIVHGGEQHLSDPNISYTYIDATGLIHIGLAGFFDASGANGLLPSSLGALIPSGAQISKIVKATYKGQTEYLFGVGAGSATHSGVSTGAANNYAYNGNYEVTVPEPTTIMLIFAGLAGFAVRRKFVAI